jgi:hypothetical protein
LQAYLDRCDRQSRLPLEHFQSLERRTATGREIESRRGAHVERIWRLTLDGKIHMSLPYSILGYHPGSLFVSQVLEVSEWRLGERNLHVPQDGGVSVIPASNLIVLRIDSGWIVLDVDGWLDKLLGRKLDDCWTQGFAICRQEGRMCGLTLSVNRNLQPLYGEFDFYADEILPMGRPVARGIHMLCRPWVTPSAAAATELWQYER